MSLVLKNVEDDHLNDSLGNPGLISPDKDLSRLLVMQHACTLSVMSVPLAPVPCVIDSMCFA